MAAGEFDGGGCQAEGTGNRAILSGAIQWQIRRVLIDGGAAAHNNQCVQ